ncbi:MAG: hypothetical protein AB7K68_12855 [Bacteriovoracia bacterium]
MNAFKYSIAVVIPILCFAFGIYFQSYMPDSTREIASFGLAQGRSVANTKVDVKVSSALRDCLNDQVKDNKMALNKSGVDGRNWAIVSVNCIDDKAKALYDAVQGYSSEQYVRYSDGRRGVGRFFGRLYPPSQCVRVIARKGSEANFYSCRIFIDLDYDLIQNLKL